ncbi:hypothetical protein [Zavarzinia sp. CC-PAN008]|uniref:hypothetical protein n=1 Tax=Zavarzinia sp. CC-PAN008 TaxID=3243332 RepID=UPI003F743083
MKTGLVGAVVAAACGLSLLAGGASAARADALDNLQGAWRQDGGTCNQLDYVWTRTGYDTFRYQCQSTDLGSCDFNDVQVSVYELRGNRGYQVDYPKGVWEQFRFRGPNRIEFYASNGGYTYSITRCY